MCGIFGELRLSVGGPASVFGDPATDTLVHRGPDERGTWSGDGIFLGMRRLSIIDLACGQQPIWNEDRSLCIVYNGELYNFEDLRSELLAKGHLFQTASDTEVVLHAYEEWGTGCLRRFNGMFALAIWDNRQRSLLLARDRIGEKPLYYYQDAERLIFASEIKAILTDRTIPREINPRGLANFLAFGHAIAPETMLRGISKLLPGHYLIADHDRVQVHQYWDIGDQTDDKFSTLDEASYVTRIRELLDDSVRRRLVADVPVGAFLSGGVDSSAVVALMQRHASAPVKTFSLGFSLGGAYNELSDARLVASALGTDHNELDVHHVDLVEVLRTLVYHYDEPFGDAACFPVYLLSRFARQHVKVVLGGDGGDELFGGYRRYAVDQLAPIYQHLPGVLQHTLFPLAVNGLPRFRRLKRTIQTLPVGNPALRYSAWLRVFSHDMLDQLLTTDLRESLDGYDPAAVYPKYYPTLNGKSASDHLNRLMYVDVKTLLADGYMEKLDKATMACSLEARLPILDYRLVELAFQIPSRFKIRGFSTKRIFKEAVRPLIPETVLKKPKHGFAVPTDPWFRGELRSFAYEVLLDGSARRRGFFNLDVVESLWKDHVTGRHTLDAPLWLLMNFELWNRIYMDGESI